MTDLISRQAAIDAIDKYYKEKMYIVRSRTILSAICLDMKSTMESLPAAPVREVKRGKWIIKNGVQYAPEDEQGCVKVIKVQCSSCGWRMYLTESLEQAWNYCPNCGADLREDE